jgi:uncharacterized membrane protein YbhN (UPF0104 family)
MTVVGALAITLVGKAGEFAHSLGAAPLWILALAILLHVAWLVARSESWHVCVEAAGGSVSRRRLYRASSLGYLGNLFNGQFGLAVRIAALRRSAPADSPKPAVLVAAELPIVIIEIGLAAICSFTLIGPLGAPWWIAIVVLATMAALFAAGGRFLRNRRGGFWRGLSAMRHLGGRNRIIALTVFAVCAQIVRNWLVLKGIGADVSIFDSTALLIGMAALGLLPVGPSLGAAAAVLILGAHGVAAVAAAGALLTATAAVGAVCFAAWALMDRVRVSKSVPAAAPG